MPAFMRSAKSPIWTSSRTGSPTRSATRSTRSSGRIRSACSHASERGRISTHGFRRLRAIISIASSIAVPRLRSSECAPGACSAPLDAEAMHQAAQVLIGNHDFTTFRSTECQAKSPIKTLDRLDVSRHGEIIRVETSARSFLHNQVRSMVGSLKLVGEGRWSAQMNCGRLWRPATAAPAERSRRRKASISSRSTIKPTASRCRAFMSEGIPAAA